MPSLSTDQGMACCEMKGNVPHDDEILGQGVGGGIRKEDTALKDKINAAIAELAKTGEIRRDHRQISRPRTARCIASDK